MLYYLSYLGGEKNIPHYYGCMKLGNFDWSSFHPF